MDEILEQVPVELNKVGHHKIVKILTNQNVDIPSVGT